MVVGESSEERIQVGLVTIVPARGWMRSASLSAFPAARDAKTLEDTSAPASSRAKQLVLSSPRSDGCFQLETIAMPSDMGSFDCERLRKLVQQRTNVFSREHELPKSLGWLSKLHGETFDHTEWTEGGIACIGFSMIWKLSSFPPTETPADDAAMLAQQLPEVSDEEEPSPPKLPSIERDWYLAHGTDMANVWYRCSSADEAAADIADCEDMLRSLRFYER
jgi:hypothetical protein